MTLLTATAVCVFIGLGRWQWHRADEKRSLAAQFSAGTSTAIEVGEQSTGSMPRYSHIRFVGHYDLAHQFLLDNISHDGYPGYEVLTPFVREQGSAIIVNRGWVPLTRSRAQLPDLALPAPDTPPASVAGLIDNLPLAALAMGHVPPQPGSGWPKLTSFPTIADLSATLGRPLESRQLLLGADQPEGYVRDWRPSGFGPAQNLSYAFQWWAFAALAATLYAVLNRRTAAR
jgi:surfeit locus 1 family protein